MTEQIATDYNRMIRIAALSLDSQGRMSRLAKAAGVSKNAITVAIRNGRFSAGLASALERAVGREVLKAEELCPACSPK